MIKQAGMNMFYKQCRTTQDNRRSTKYNEEFCQKAPLYLRSFLGLQLLCFKFSKSTIPVKNYTNKCSNDLIYKKNVILFHDMGSQVRYYIFNIEILGNHKKVNMSAFFCICYFYFKPTTKIVCQLCGLL